MVQPGQKAPPFPFTPSQRGPHLLFFFQTDCPACQLCIPYLNKLTQQSASVAGISQDSEERTRPFLERMSIAFPVELDRDLALSRAYDPAAVPAFFLIGAGGQVILSQLGFDKEQFNALCAAMLREPVADAFDGAPAWKPGCSSRHLEPADTGASPEPLNLHAPAGARASRIEVSEDPYDYCARFFGEPLPVVPPTLDRVEKMIGARNPVEVIARVPPCYGEATIEKIAANAVMAGCPEEAMRVLIPLVRAVCDERFNAHGVQATTHFAAPLIVVNGPVRRELGFACTQNVFSNVARANSTVGRALQLIMTNLGGARPDGIDMSALGNPGKFSYCIAENEEASPWEPLHVELEFAPDQSTVTLFAGEAPHGVSEHVSRTATGVLKAITRALATVWSYRACLSMEALVVLGPEHARTINGGGFSKQAARQYLFEHTGIPLRAYDEEGEGTQQVNLYREIMIDGERCYQKFRAPESIKIVVAGGTAGKFSAVIGSWAAGPRGSQMVTYPCP